MPTARDPRDPTLDAEVERALEPYRQILPPEVVRILQDVLEHALLTHPVGAELLDRVRPRAAREHSGAQAKAGTGPAASPAARPRKAGGK